MTTDRAFDGLKGLRRVDPLDTAAISALCVANARPAVAEFDDKVTRRQPNSRGIELGCWKGGGMYG